MRTSRLLAAALLAPAGDPIDAAVARARFAEARDIAAKDDGALWGKRLDGPILFVDPATRACVASQADAEGRLAARDGVFAGSLPPEVNVANTATRWAGVEWTMLRWPLPEAAAERRRLLAHELFHRVQASLGLPLGSPPNAHLDTKSGRVALRLELRALAAAVVATGAERREAIEDALVFRASRRAAHRAAAAEERALEMNEGLAEYTGVRLGGVEGPDRALLVVELLEQAVRKPSFVRSFAYATGPAYGVLLDEAEARWRPGLTPERDLGGLLGAALSIAEPADPAAVAEKRSARYGGRAIVAEEEERDALRARKEAPLRARLVDGPVLSLRPGARFSYSFDPSAAVALQGVGTAYAALRVTDEWGVLEATKGALLVQEEGGISRVHVPAPTDRTARPLRGDGWTLELADGWMLDDGPRKGDVVLRRRP